MYSELISHGKQNEINDCTFQCFILEIIKCVVKFEHTFIL